MGATCFNVVRTLTESFQAYSPMPGSKVQSAAIRDPHSIGAKSSADVAHAKSLMLPGGFR